MNKLTRILLALGLILAVAAPAFAEFKLNGYYRLIGYNEAKKVTLDTNGDSNDDTQQFIDQRLRMRANWTLNDNVAMVYFAEVDTTWGENNKASINQGGMSNSFGGGADGVNVETKQAYLDLKYADTAAQLGIIGVADAFESIVANDDMAAVQVTQKFGDTSLKLVYSKWDEDDFNDSAANDSTVRGEWDDFDFYGAEVNQKFSDNFKAGLGVYFMDNNSATGPNVSNIANSTNTIEGDAGNDAEVRFYGINAAFTSGDFGLTGFVMMQDGDFEYASSSSSDFDYTGYAATAKATYKLANGDLGLRVIYFSEDDDDEDNGYWQGFKGQYAFVKENQMQFLTDPYVMNDGKERYAEADAAEQGFGLLAFVLSGNHKLPQDMYLNWGAGYYLAMDDERNDPSTSKPSDGTLITSSSNYREGDTLGYEVCVRVGKKIFEKVDISLNGSYADYGDFYDDTVKDADGVTDPDATYKTYFMVNVPF